jgi:quinol monooxygenase YgiN
MVIETVDYNIKNGSEAEFERIFAILQKVFRTVPGCVGTRLFRDTKDTSSFVLFMQWQSQEALDEMRKDPGFDDWRTRSRELADGPSKPRFYTETL